MKQSLNITFIVPPRRERSRKAAERTAGCTRIVYPAPNIYELTVAALLRSRGHSVAYRDMVFDDLSVRDLAAFLEHDTSEVYCIWSVNLAMEDDLPAIADVLKLRPEARVVVMGPAATYYARRFVSSPRVMAVRGEPDLTVAELMDTLAAGGTPEDVKGVTWMDSEGTLHVNPPRTLMKQLDDLPFPARDLIARRQYHNPKLKTGPYTTMVTSRNCPFRCIYCVPSSLTFAREIEYREHNRGHKPPIAFRSVESIAREVEQLSQEGFRAIGFMDDNFIWNEERTLAICRIMKRAGIIWGCQARVDAITEPIARALGESGCRYVDIGVESFDAAILKYIKKGITPEQIFEAIRLLKKYRVPVKLNVLIGSSPLETLDTIRDTLRKAKRLRVDQVMFNIVSPFPGTEFHSMAMENGWIEGGEYRPTDVQRESILNYPHLTARQMEAALARNNRLFFLSPRFVVSQLKRFSSFKEFWAAVKALKVKLMG